MRRTIAYLAAPWIHRNTAKAVRDQLIAAGYDVSSRWLDVDETKTTQEAEARNDWDDIIAADILIVLNLSKSEGKAVEQGIALQAGKQIFYIGDGPANVFQHLSSRFSGFATIEDFINR